MVRMLYSVLLSGIAGNVAVSMLIPLLLLLNLSGLVPESQVSAVSELAEGLWLALVIPPVLFLTGAGATRLAGKWLSGLTDCFSVAFPAGIIALLPGILLFMDHYPGSARPLLAGFSAAALLAAVAGSFACFYLYRILPSRRRTFETLAH